jgi:hypothetical protein
MMKISIFCAALGTLAFTGNAIAHHTHAHYEAERTVVINGTIKDFEWTNPHSWVTISVTDQTGVAKDWLLEARGTGALARRGWSKDSLKPGDNVAVTIRPLKSGGSGGLVRAVTLPDGKVLEDP